MQDKKETHPPAFERWFAPITAGVVVAAITSITQLVIQPTVSLHTEQNISHLNQKRDAYVKAGGLVNRMWLAIDWQYGDQKLKATQPKPSAVELNDCVMLLFMVADDPAIPKMFTDMMFNTRSEFKLQLGDRLTLFNAMRKDLYGEEIHNLPDLKGMPYLFDTEFEK